MRTQWLALLSVFFLCGMFLLTATSSAFRMMQRRRSLESLRHITSQLFYMKIQNWLLPKDNYEILYLSTVFGQNLARFGYASCTTAFLITLQLFPPDTTEASSTMTIVTQWAGGSAILFLIVTLSLLVGDLLPRKIGNKHPERVGQIGAFFTSVFLTLQLPITLGFLKMAPFFTRSKRNSWSQPGMVQVKEQIIEIIEDPASGLNMDPEHRKLIESAINFRQPIVREIMVPRVNVFCLPADMSVKEAAEKLFKEGYSRVPIYHDNIDHIVGMLMYKDLMELYSKCLRTKDFSPLDAPVHTIAKEVLYTPETKKVYQMLQGFRRKQMHLAVVVDEYGGTEGVVTIEDILERIVGEIEDEYDQDERLLFTLQSDGTWIVDGSMTLLDIEEKLDVKIPHLGDYDTVAGYLFHRVGTIPERGMIIHHNDFDLEVLSSDERRIQKVRITPLHPHSPSAS